MMYSTALRARSFQPTTFKLLGLLGALALGACNDPDSDDKDDAGSTADARVDDPSPEEDAGAPAEDAGSPDARDEEDASEEDASEEPDASDEADAAEPAGPDTCAFTVDGTTYEADTTKVDTLALFYPATGDITVNCGVTDGDLVRIINVSVKADGGPGTYTNSIVQYSEQPTGGGSITQWRKFGAEVVVTSASEAAVAATTSADASGTAGANRQVSVRFNMSPTLR